jgi:hypothetical protein
MEANEEGRLSLLKIIGIRILPLKHRIEHMKPSGITRSDPENNLRLLPNAALRFFSCVVLVKHQENLTLWKDNSLGRLGLILKIKHGLLRVSNELENRKTNLSHGSKNFIVPQST